MGEPGGRAADLLPREADGLLLVDERGIILYADPRAAAQLAQPRRALIGQPVERWLPGLPAAAAPVDLRLPVRQGAAECQARVFPTESGFGVYLWDLALDPSAAGGPGQGRLALYEAVLAGVRDAVLVTTSEPFDAPGPVIVFANEAFYHHTGYAPEEVLGRSPRFLQGPDTDPRARAAFREALEAWRPATIELLNYRKDGTPFWVEIDMVPLADEAGWYTHWVSVQRDVTARHEAEAEREAYRAVVQNALDALPAQTALLDPTGRIRAVNEAWRRLWQRHAHLPEPDWTGVNYLGVCVAADRAGCEAAGMAAKGIRAVLSGGVPQFAMDYDMGTPDDPMWFHMQVVPLSTAGGAVVTHSDISARKAVEAELGHRATHDVLTGLPNRDLLRERLAAALDSVRDGDRKALVAFIDLDDFKDINDAYGHDYGDLLLVAISDRLRAAMPPGGLVARLGGDEYVLLLPDLPPDWDPEPFLHRVRHVLSEPIDLGITSVRASASIGLVTSPPHVGGADAILRDADTAMYAAKRAGRDQWTLFTLPLRDGVLSRLLTEGRLRRAMEEEEFALFFQPIVRLPAGRVVGSEALLRWIHPEQGLLTPESFLAAVESGPLVESVGAWVLDRALAIQERWQRIPGHGQHVMSVNVSARQLGRGAFPDIVRDALARWDIAGSRLVVEILEDTLVQMHGAAREELAALRELGVRIALDDFGTGYSSIAYLQELPIDVVKVDRAFLAEPEAPRAGRLLGAVRTLAEAVGADVVAEGVETPEQLAMVTAAGITRAQGFLLGRPRPPGDEPPGTGLPLGFRRSG